MELSPTTARVLCQLDDFETDSAAMMREAADLFREQGNHEMERWSCDMAEMMQQISTLMLAWAYAADPRERADVMQKVRLLELQSRALIASRPEGD